MLTNDISNLIRNHTAGMVATVNDDGSPSVSPKATFVIVNPSTLAFGNLRSPGTLANLRKRPATEVCFIDVISRKAARVTGTATIVARRDADHELLKAFQENWSDYLDAMSHFVRIDLSRAELILSPAYDLGITEESLRQTNLEKLNRL